MMNEGKKQASGLHERTKRNLTIYGVLLAAFVLTLLLGSYINQRRVDREMEQALKRLDEKTEYAEGVEHNIALLQEENVGLKETVTELQGKITDLETEIEAVQQEKVQLQTAVTQKDEEKAAALKEEEQKVKAYESLVSLVKLYDKRDYSGCRKAVASMESAGLPAKLSEAMRAEYEQIKRKID